MLPETVLPDSLEVFPETDEPVHVAIVLPLDVSLAEVPVINLAVTVVPLGYTVVQLLFVQSLVADAKLTPTSDIRPMAPIAARVRIRRYFIAFSQFGVIRIRDATILS